MQVSNRPLLMHLSRVGKRGLVAFGAGLATWLLLAASSWAEPPAAGQNWLEAFAETKPITLTDGKIKGFIATARELHNSDFDYQPPDNNEGPSIESWAAAIAADSRVEAVIRRHGFRNAEDFARTTHSVTMALGAMEMQQHQPEIEQAKAQLAQMKDQLPPETYAMLEQQMLGAMSMFANQPEENLALVAKYRAELEKLSDEE